MMNKSFHSTAKQQISQIHTHAPQPPRIVRFFDRMSVDDPAGAVAGL